MNAGRFVSRLTRQEPVELLLRLFVPAPGPPRGALRRLRVLSHRGRHRRRPVRRDRGRAAARARALARRRSRACYEGRRPSTRWRSGCRGRCGISRSRGPRSTTSSTASRWTSTRSAYETFEDALSVLLPRGLGRRPLLHRDLRLHGPARPGLRRQPRHRAPAHQHHARRGGRCAGRPRVPAAGGPAEVRRHGRATSAGRYTPRRSSPHGARGGAGARLLRAAWAAFPAVDRRALVPAEIMGRTTRPSRDHRGAPVPGVRRARDLAHGPADRDRARNWVGAHLFDVRARGPRGGPPRRVSGRTM